MKKHVFQFIQPQNKECEEDAKFNKVKWKHKGNQCPYCILLDDEKDLRNLRNTYEESWSLAEHRLITFRLKIPIVEGER